VISAVEVRDGNNFLGNISMEEVGKKEFHKFLVFEGGKENEL